MAMFCAPDIGVDLGTSNVLVYIKDKGIVLNAPSVVAINRNSNKIVAIGEEARRMQGRTPGNITIIRPLREGVIADYEKTEAMLKYFIQKVAGRRLFFKPRVMVSISPGVTGVEKRAVLEAAMQAGASSAYLIEKPLAAALGCGLDFSKARGAMIMSIGGGTTDIAVLSLGGVVVSASARVGGEKFDEAIVRYVKKEYNLLIGEATAEEIKINAASAFGQERDECVEIRGRDLVSGLPRITTITSAKTQEALSEPLDMIVGCVRGVLEKTPPELSADMVSQGLILTGGGALLYGLDKLLWEKTGVPVRLADNMLSCVATGTGKALTLLENLREHLITLKQVGLNR